MSDRSPLRTMSVEEYLEFEERSPVRHEYVSGELYAMTGATVRHSRIVRNIGTRLSLIAGDGPCDVFTNDMRLAVGDDVFYYPDVIVTCLPLAELDVVAREPCVVIEVTSPSTARVDRGEKVAAYRTIPSLLAYLIVDHRRRRVERHRRADAGGEWMREEVVGDGSVPVPCLDAELSLDVIYRRVDLAVIAEPEGEEYEA